MHIFTRQSIRNWGKSTHVLKVANFMTNLKNTKLLSFLWLHFIIVKYTCVSHNNPFAGKRHFIVKFNYCEKHAR